MIQVYLTKRSLAKRKRNGTHEYRWILRWEDSSGWKQETTGTADRTAAEALQKAKWQSLNLPTEQQSEREPEPIKASWNECRNALERAMQADNLRPSYVDDTLRMFDMFRRMFPDIPTPADVTPEHANEYKRQRAEAKLSPWSIKGDLATLNAAFGKWLARECGLLQSNPFANVRPPKCDDPEVRLVSAAESEALFIWLTDRWNGWQLPMVFLEVASMLARATETASIRQEDLLADGYVHVYASKTRKHKYGWLPADLYERVQDCCADGWAFGRFSDDLRRLLMLLRQQPNHAAKVREFSPKRLVGWLQDELARFNDGQTAKAAEAGKQPPERFTLHDFRRTAITGLQMAGVSEKEASIMVGASPEVMRRHYEKLEKMTIAKRSVQRRIGDPNEQALAHRLRGARKGALDGDKKTPQTISA